MPAETNVTKAGTNASRNIIINNTIYFVVEKDNDTATCSAALLNSIAVRVFLQTFSAKARRGWFSHFSWSNGLIPVPQKFSDIKNDLDRIDPNLVAAKLYYLANEEIYIIDIDHQRLAE
jgi:hypothetical protein